MTKFLNSAEGVSLKNQNISKLLYLSCDAFRAFWFWLQKTSKDVDVDVNMVENFIDSLTSEDGWSGPTRNILQSMGINLPPDEGT